MARYSTVPKDAHSPPRLCWLYDACLCAQPAYAKSGNGDASELWVMILEKAFAKHYGSYKALDGGLVHMGLVDLTGGAAETIQFKVGTKEI